MENMPIGNSEWRVDHELDATKKRADVLLVYSEPSKTEPGMVRWAGLLLEAGGCPGSTELVYRRIGGVVAVSLPELLDNHRWEPKTLVMI